MRKINVFALNIYDVSEDAVSILHKKQQQRINNIKNERAKKQALAAEILLLYCVKKFCPENVPVPPLRVSGEFGKPYFAENTEFHFNLSHSGDWSVIAVADSDIGVDIEKTCKIRTNIAKRVLHEQEKVKFFSLDMQTQKKRFYDYWVLKESIVKATGKGMNDSFSDIHIEFDDKISLKTSEKECQLFLWSFDKDAYKIGICILSKEKYKILTKILSSQEIMV